MGEAGRALDTFGKEKLAPAMEEAGKALSTFKQEKLGPAVGEVAKALDTFGKEKLGPAMAVTGVALDTFGKEKLGPAIAHTGEVLRNNSGTTAAIVMTGLTFMVPGLVSGPLLWVFGWGGAGVRAGSAAAAIQASTGNIIARSGFATLQSAAMGGYGAAAVNGVVMTCSAVVGTIGGVLGFGNRIEDFPEIRTEAAEFSLDSDTDTETEDEVRGI